MPPARTSSMNQHHDIRVFAGTRGATRPPWERLVPADRYRRDDVRPARALKAGYGTPRSARGRRW